LPDKERRALEKYLEVAQLLGKQSLSPEELMATTAQGEAFEFVGWRRVREAVMEGVARNYVLFCGLDECDTKELVTFLVQFEAWYKGSWSASLFINTGYSNFTDWQGSSYNWRSIPPEAPAQMDRPFVWGNPHQGLSVYAYLESKVGPYATATPYGPDPNNEHAYSFYAGTSSDSDVWVAIRRPSKDSEEVRFGPMFWFLVVTPGQRKGVCGGVCI